MTGQAMTAEELAELVGEIAQRMGMNDDPTPELERAHRRFAARVHAQEEA